MATAHFFVDELAGPRVTLGPEDSRHALRSLRLRTGEAVSLADGRGAVARGHLTGEEGQRAVIQIDEVGMASRPTPMVSVAMANPGWDRLRWAVQKRAELGTSEVLILETERSVRERRTGPSLDRLRAVAREAAKQSRQAFVAEVRGGYVMPPKKGEGRSALDAEGFAVIMLWEKASTPVAHSLPGEARAVRLLVGPEGGFTDEEAEIAQQHDAALASLGPNILRTETAAVVGVALVLARYGRLG